MALTNAQVDSAIPVAGTPSRTLTNAAVKQLILDVAAAVQTGGLGAGVGAFLATPSSVNLASAVTGETGTGALVFGTGPTIDAPAITGVSVVAGATSVTSSAMGALVVDITKAKNTKSISADSTLTLSAAGSTDQIFGLQIQNTDTASHVITLPVAGTFFSLGRQATITTVTLPAASKSKMFFTVTGTNTYDVEGDPIPLAQRGIPFLFPTGADDTQVVLPFVPASLAGTAASIRVTCDSGTATYQVKINGTAVTATTSSVSSTPQNQTITALNTLAANDVVSITRTANSTCVNGRGVIFVQPSTP
jgi:hypothetical protein